MPWLQVRYVKQSPAQVTADTPKVSYYLPVQEAAKLARYLRASAASRGRRHVKGIVRLLVEPNAEGAGGTFRVGIPESLPSPRARRR